MMTSEPDWCCATRRELAEWLASNAPGMTDDDIRALPRPVQCAARAVRDHEQADSN